MTESLWKMRDRANERQCSFLPDLLKDYLVEGPSDGDREMILFLVCEVLNRDEAHMDKVIQGIEGNEGSEYWSLWIDFEGDRDKLVEMIQASKRYIHGGAKKLFVDLLFQLVECEHRELACGEPLRHADEIAGNLAKALYTYRNPWKNTIAASLSAEPIGKFHSALVGTKYDMIRQRLSPMVRDIFPSDKELELAIAEILQKTSKESLVIKNRAQRVVNFLREGFSQK